jgi:hypothetical protein
VSVNSSDIGPIDLLYLLRRRRISFAQWCKTSGIDNPGIIKRCVHTAFPFTRGYAFVNSASACPLGLGAQAMQEQSLYFTFSEPKGGLCLAWSLYILAVYVLSDPSVTVADCHSFLVTTFGPDELELLVRQFITFAVSVPARPTEYAHETVYSI